MNRIFIVLCLIVVAPIGLLAQVLPKEGAKLHYRIIAFSVEPAKKPGNYQLEIAKGHYESEDSFRQHIVVTRTSTKNEIIADAPLFGQDYTWRMISPGSQEQNASGKFHHFSILSYPEADTSIIRVRVINEATKYKDAYVFLDGNNGLYDMQGNLVWHVPSLGGRFKPNSQVNDLKMTARGTITFLLNNEAFEINYEGDILWKTPNNGTVSGDTAEHYHHEFTRLSNGHYMVLGSESLYWKPELPPGYGHAETSPLGNKMMNDTMVKKNHFGTVIEYDENKNVVWSWKSSEYFVPSDIKYFNPKLKRQVIDVHENSFFFDEKNNNVYVSFKNISRIVKVKYPEGKVINAYGEEYKLNIAPTGNGRYCNQHSCKYSDEGYLYLYNNNGCDTSDAMPTVIMMQEPGPGKNNLKTVWEYVCTDEGIAENPLYNRKALQQKVRENHPEFKGELKRMARPTSGGSVTELPDHNLFVSMSSEYGKVFIVTRDKKVLWSIVAERWNKTENRWLIVLQYRASFVPDRKALEQMVSNGKKGMDK